MCDVVLISKLKNLYSGFTVNVQLKFYSEDQFWYTPFAYTCIAVVKVKRVLFLVNINVNTNNNNKS